MEVDWQRHMRTLSVEGTPVEVVELGPAGSDQAPLLLVHGLDGSWRNFLETIPHFARTRRVVALDLPGFGRSPLPRWEVSIPAYAEMLSGLCGLLGLEAVAILGSSMGGLIAAEATLLHPGLIERLAMAAPVGISIASVELGAATRMARTLAMLAPFGFRLRKASLTRMGLRGAAFGGVFAHPEQLRGELLWEHYFGAIGGERRVTPPGFMPAVRAVSGYDIRERLAHIAAPTLLVWGRDDKLVPPQDAPEFARRIDGSTLEVFGDCGHLPMLERPLRFNRVLERFLHEEPAQRSTHP
jgi:pimeloyl-ACP methyl ester carboxylesterase